MLRALFREWHNPKTKNRRKCLGWSLSPSAPTRRCSAAASRPRSSGAALSSTVPAGSLTGSVPIATATRKFALRSQTSRFPASTRQVPPSSAVKTSFFHSCRRSSSAALVRFRAESGSCSCRSIGVACPSPRGCGSHGSAVRSQPSEKPWFSAASSVHGSGTRAPSRQTPPRAHIGSTRASTGTSTSGSPSSWPW